MLALAILGTVCWLLSWVFVQAGFQSARRRSLLVMGLAILPLLVMGSMATATLWRIWLVALK